MPDDTDDRPDEPRKTKGPKKRFKERDDTDDDDDDRPRKRRPADEDDDAPPTKRRTRDDEGRGPRVKSSDGPPVFMLLGLIGSAVALLAICTGCGWWSWVWLVGGGDFGSGDSEFEVVSASRQAPLTPFDSPRVGWEVKALRDTNTKDGQYYLVMRSGTQEVVKPLSPSGKGWLASGGGPELGLKGSNGPLDVWVEKRRTQVSTDGKKVSNVYKVP